MNYYLVYGTSETLDLSSEAFCLLKSLITVSAALKEPDRLTFEKNPSSFSGDCPFKPSNSVMSCASRALKAR